MGSLAGKTAVITGATSGIGKAIALALASDSAAVHLVGRDPAALRKAKTAARNLGADARSHCADLASRADIEKLAEELSAAIERLDLLVHSAGVFAMDRVEEAAIEDMDRQYAVNVAAPLALTKFLLPNLERARGQIVFINSSLGVSAKAGTAQYGATKHALKSIADSLRQEVNERGIRVLSVYPGRTATRMQETLCLREGRPYAPGSFLQPDDVASMVLSALRLRHTAEVTDIHIRGMRNAPPARKSSERTAGGAPGGNSR